MSRLARLPDEDVIVKKWTKVYNSTYTDGCNRMMQAMIFAKASKPENNLYAID